MPPRRRGGKAGGANKVPQFPTFTPGGVLQPFAGQPDDNGAQQQQPVQGDGCYAQDYFDQQQGYDQSGGYEQMAYQQQGYPQQQQAQWGSNQAQWTQPYQQQQQQGPQQQQQQTPKMTRKQKNQQATPQAAQAQTPKAAKPAQAPAAAKPVKPAVPQPVKKLFKEVSWEKVSKMKSFGLRTLPLDSVHVLEEGKRKQCRVVQPTDMQTQKTALLESLDPAFVNKCLGAIELKCDCCSIDFSGPTKIQDMMRHIETPLHYDTLRAKLNEDMLYAYKMNKTNLYPSQPNPQQQQANAAAKKKAKRPAEDGQAATGNKKVKNEHIPEEYRPMADWVACYVCNITCPDVAILETHQNGKRHQRILELAPQHVRRTPWGPYLVDGRPTIDTALGGVKLAIAPGHKLERVGGDQPQLVNAPWLGKVQQFVAAAKLNSAPLAKMEV